MSLTVDSNNYRIDASRGDDHKIRFTVLNSSGVAYNVSANSFAFTVKESLDDPITSALFQRTSPAANGIDLTSATSGIVDVNLVPSNTSALAGRYFYDLQMTEGGKVYTLRQGIFFVKKDVTTTGSVPGPSLREVIVDPSGVVGGFTTVAAALAYVVTQNPTVASPWTIRVTTGVCVEDVPISLLGYSGINIIGSGRGVTIIRASNTLLNTLASNSGSVIDFSASDTCSLADLTLDSLTNATAGHMAGLWSGQAINADEIVGTILIKNVEIQGASAGLISSTQTASATLEIRDSLIRAAGFGVRVTGNQIVRIFNSRIEAIHNTANFDNSFVSQNTSLYLDTLGTHDVAIYSSYLYCEETVSPARATGAVFYQSQSSTSRLLITGTTCHVKQTTDFTSSQPIASIDIHSDPGTDGKIAIVGCDLILSTPSSMTQGVAGGLIYGTAVGTASIDLVGCNFIDLGGDTTGDFHRNAITQNDLFGPALSKFKIAGGHFLTGPTGNGTLGNVVNENWGITSGSTTLASGVKKVLLVTDAGNQGAATKTFTSGGLTVTGGTTFLTQFKRGDYVKANGHADDTWTQIDSLTNATLTLKEGYRGANATAIPRRGTLNAQTQPDSSYRVLVTPTAAPGASELFYVTLKHASGFTINSSDGASVKTLDWMVIR